MEGKKETVNLEGGGVRDILIFKERNKINIKLYARHNNYASPRLIRYY